MTERQPAAAPFAELSDATEAILDAIPAKVALVDQAGRIAAVNTAWEEYGRNGDSATSCAIGASYVEAAGRLAGDDAAASGEAAARLKGVLDGTLVSASLVYPCRSSGQQRWFCAYFTRLPEGGKYTAAAMHFDITASMVADQQLSQPSHFDGLTGLPNRALYFDRLRQACASADRHGWKLGIALVDLDRHEGVNDSVDGHPGDTLIQLFGQRLAECVHRSDTIARLGGSTFALILPELKEAGEAGLVARKLINFLRKPFNVAGQEVFGTASVGIAIYPEDSRDPETLLHQATQAAKRAWEAGRNSFRYCAAAMNDQAMLRLQLDNELRCALSSGEFELFYHPKLSCTSGAIVGAEALLRWHHPKRGLLLPTEFLPILEELDLTDELDSRVIEEACRQIRRWQDGGLKPPAIAINLSTRQLDGSDLVAKVSGALDRHGVPPYCLEIELTESFLMRDAEHVIPVLAGLRQLGVKLAVDDFGTGYSNLSHLRRFPLDSVKVDRSFVQDIAADFNEASITRAVITMAHQLKLKVVAEGVETESQLALLVANQCDEIQGFLFSHPVPAADLEAMLRENRCLPPELIQPSKRQRTILLVDDEENILSSLRRLLRRDGYQILATTSGLDGLELLAKNPVDVIVSDQRMPTMTGVEFLRRAKTIQPDTVRIVLSGYTELQSITDAINEGAIYKFLTKPWDDDQLRANIAEAFHHKELTDDNRRLGHQLQIANADLGRTNQQLQELLETKQQRIVRDEAMLGVIQDVLQQVPIPIAGLDNDGLVVFANEEANVVLGGGIPMLGSFAADCLPAPLLDLLTRPRGETLLWKSAGTTYLACCRATDERHYAKGVLLMLVPQGAADT